MDTGEEIFRYDLKDLLKSLQGATELPPGTFTQRDFVSRQQPPPDPGFVSGPPFPLTNNEVTPRFDDEPPGRIEIPAAASGRSFSSGRATATVTPSQELQAAFASMQERVKVLEDLLAWMSPPDRHGIGANFPPEPIDDAPLSSAEWSDLRQDIVVLRSQEVVPAQQPTKAIEAESLLRAYANKIRSFLSRLVEEYSSSLAQRLGDLSAVALPAALVFYGHGALSHLSNVLVSVSEAVQSWLHLLGY
jgi:hypothetical protein